MHGLGGCLAGWFDVCVCLDGWLAGRLVGWLAVGMVGTYARLGCVPGWVAAWVGAWMGGWLGGWSVGLQVVW